jgi:DNA repair protein RadC
MKPEDLSHEEQDNIIKLALEILSERYQTGTMLTSPHAVRTYLQLQLAERTREVFALCANMSETLRHCKINVGRGGNHQ